MFRWIFLLILLNLCFVYGADSNSTIMFSINSTPTNCQVWIDGNYTHHLTPTDEIEQKDVIELWTEGKHNLKLTKTGYLLEREIEIVKGTKLILDLVLNNLTEQEIEEQESSVNEKQESSVKIVKIMNKNLSFGDIAKIKLEVVKADGSQNSVKLWIENLTEKYDMNFYGKNKNFSFIVPLKIDDNCRGKYANGTYKIILDGLDDRDEEEVFISGQGDCKEKEKKVYVQNKTTIEKIINMSENCIIYKSDDKQQRIGVYFLCFVLILLVIGYELKHYYKGNN